MVNCFLFKIQIEVPSFIVLSPVYITSILNVFTDRDTTTWWIPSTYRFFPSFIPNYNVPSKLTFMSCIGIHSREIRYLGDKIFIFSAASCGHNHQMNIRRVFHQMIDDFENLTDVFVPHYTQSSKYRVCCTPIMWIASMKPHLLT